MKKHWMQLSALLLAAMLCACSAPAEAPEMEAQTEVTETEPITEITMVVTQDSILQLEEYPALRRADLTGSTCYAAMDQYRKNHPEVEVIYTVSLGETEISLDVTELELPDGSFDPALLLENLQYLPKLKTIRFPETELTAQSLAEIAAACPEAEISYTVSIAGKICAPDVQELDLSGLSSEDVVTAARKLALLPNLTQAELMAEGEKEGHLTLEDVALLQQSAPDAVFHYRFLLFDQLISTTDEEIVYKDKYIGNRIENAEEQLRQALSVLQGCNRFVLSNCHFDNETLAQLREEFREKTKLVWRVWFGESGTCLTDQEVIRYVYGLTGNNGKDLIYCEDARFIDIGHNETLFDVDFVSSMKKLEAIIVSGAPIRDLTPFENCESLEFLELAYCGYVEDISPLVSCTNLKRLNIAFTAVEDLSALDELPMEVMVDTGTKTSAEQKIRFEDLHPDCLVQHSGDQPYGYPWRYTKENKANDYYSMLRRVFDYDHAANTRIW